MPVGSYALTARGTDNAAQTGDSAAVLVFVTASGAWEGVVATGGTVTNYTQNGTNYTAHLFTTVGTSSFNATAGGNVEVLVIGGGGGGSLATGNNSGDSGGGNGGSGLVIVRYVTGGTVNPDASANGLPDAWEAQYFGGTIDPTADPDGDRMNNLQEYQAGTIPTNGAAYLGFTACGPRIGVPSDFIIRWQSVSDHWYTVQAATNLLTGFDPIPGASNIPATYPVNVYTDDTANVGMRFYRIRVQE